jgi:molybdate transport system permease protein
MQWEPLLISFEVATVATVAALVAGVALGERLSGRHFWGRELLSALVTAPMVLPPTVLGYFLLVWVGRNSTVGHVYESFFGEPIVFTFTGAVLAALIGSLPLVVRAARVAFEQIDPTLISAARTLGATPARTFWQVRLPLAARGIAAGTVLAFVRSLGDFGATLMVAGNIPHHTRTAALAIYDATESGRDADAAGMIAVLTALAIFVSMAAAPIARSRDAG